MNSRANPSVTTATRLETPPSSTALPDGDVELVIFDCDGVLVDSESIYVAIEARILTEMGWPVSIYEAASMFMGQTNDAIVRQVADRLGPARGVEFLHRTKEAALAEFPKRLRPVDGALEAVESLHTHGVMTCVASNGSHEKMQFTLGLTGLYDAFVGRIFSRWEVAAGKPAPDLFLHASETMGVPPARSVVVEDSLAGVKAARSAGMRCLGYDGGFFPAETLAEVGAVIFDRMQDLTARLGLGPGPTE